MLDKLLINGTIVTKDSRFAGNVGIKGEKISCILAPDEKPEAAEVIDLQGKYLIPGMIDAHVHFEDPGHTDREDMPHGSAACAVGGVTTVVLMPTNDPLALTLEAWKANMDSYAGRAYVDYGMHGGVDAKSFPYTRELWRDSGATAIKAFMCYSSANMGYVNDETLYETLELAKEEDALVLLHCENDDIINLNNKRMKEAGRTDRLSFNHSRPGFGEVEAIRRALYFAKRLGNRVVICHVSTADGLEEIRRAKEEGVQVWAESCPQYFTFTTDDFEKQGPYLKFTPVMHEQDNQDRMWDLIGKGYVDTIGSDHSPFSVEEKEVGIDNIWKAPNGIPGLEAELAVFLNGVNQGRITLEDLVRMTSYNPAKAYSIPNKGEIRVGYDADLTVVDMELEKEFSKETIASKCPWSPYMGRRFKGWPVMTIVRGSVVAKDGRLTGELGYGKPVYRRK
ncbi:MAG: dihydroorotase [Candidatus Heteroscillospira sp.]|jgi:allantoinase